MSRNKFKSILTANHYSIKTLNIKNEKPLTQQSVSPINGIIRSKAYSNRYIRFDDKNSRTNRQRTDKFAAIRELWNPVLDNCQKSYFPHADVTVDEQLFPCRLRL